MRCLIVGAGLAGSLTALRLARKKWNVTLIDKRSAGQSTGVLSAGHLHSLSSETVFWLHELTRQAMSDELFGQLSAGRILATWTMLADICTRAIRSTDQITSVMEQRLATLTLSGGHWYARWNNGAGTSFDLVIDCSGRALAAARLGCQPGSVEQEEVADDYLYQTWQLCGERTRESGIFQSLELPDSEAAHLLVQASGQGYLTWYGPKDRSPNLERIAASLASDYCAHGGQPLDIESLTEIARFSGGCVALTSVSECAVPLLLLGDSLIQTPPRFGGGISQIRQQLEIVDKFAGESDFKADRCRESLAELAESLWCGHVLTMGIEQSV